MYCSEEYVETVVRSSLCVDVIIRNVLMAFYEKKGRERERRRFLILCLKVLYCFCAIVDEGTLGATSCV
jgi:hypothetical protein